MIGVTPSGEEVVVDRDGRPEPHPLAHASIAEIRAAMVRSLRAANRSWADIAKAMRCSASTCQSDASLDLIPIRRPGFFADAG